MQDIMNWLIQFLNVVILLMTMGSFFVILAVVGLTVASVARNKTVKWQKLAYAGLALVGGLGLIKFYPPAVMGAILESFQETMPIADELRDTIMATFIEGTNGDSAIIIIKEDAPIIIAPPVISPLLPVPESTPYITPESAPQPTPGAQASANTYTFKAGDTISGIAESHGVSIRAIMEANGLNCLNCIQDGDILVIPNVR